MAYKIMGTSLVRCATSKPPVVTMCWRCFSRAIKLSVNAKVTQLVDPDWISTLVDTLNIKTGLTNKSKTILHINPVGPTLTEALLNAGVENVVVWQPKVLKNSHFKALRTKHKTRLKLNPRYFYLGEDFTPFNDLKCSWDVENDKVMLLGMLPVASVANYIHILTMHLANTVSIHSLGRVPQFLFLQEKEVEMMSTEHHLQSKSSMHKIYYQMFFDIENIIKVPLSAFKGQMAGKGKGSRDFHLVKILPKRDLLFHGLDLFVFLKFLRFLKRNSSKRMIPLLENVCPNCGPEIIPLGYGMQDLISSVPAQTWPHIYKLISACPEFKQSAAYHSFIDNYGSEEEKPDS